MRADHVVAENVRRRKMAVLLRFPRRGVEGAGLVDLLDLGARGPDAFRGRRRRRQSETLGPVGVIAWGQRTEKCENTK